MILKGVYDLDEDRFMDFESADLLKGATVARVEDDRYGALFTLTLRLADGVHLLDIDADGDDGNLALSLYDEGGSFDAGLRGPRPVCAIGGDE